MFRRIARVSSFALALLASSPSFASISILDSKLVVQPPGGGIATGGIYAAVASKSGRYVVLETTAANLAPGYLSSNHAQILWVDTKTGARKVISRGPGGQNADEDCLSPQVSSNGKKVVFISRATNLGADANGSYQAFLADVTSGEITVVSRKWNGVLANKDVLGCEIAGNGRSVVFSTTASSLFGSVSNVVHLYIYDVDKATLEAHSFNSSGSWANESCFDPHLSQDGRYLVYYSSATNLPDDGAPMGSKIILHDRKTGDSYLVSQSKEGVPADASCYFPAMSANGRYIAFRSTATNLTSDAGPPGTTQVFVKDRITGKVTRNDIPLDVAAGEGVYSVSLSDDGRRLAVETERFILPDFFDIFARSIVVDRKTGHVVTMDPGPVGGTLNTNDTLRCSAITGDGKKLFFLSSASVFGFVQPVSNQAFELSLKGL